MWVDTHTHLYLPEFDNDQDQVIQQAIDVGVNKMFFPNIDTISLPKVLTVCNNFSKNCFPLIGLHPCSVKKDFEKEISILEDKLRKNKFYGIGEIGIDLYWDNTFLKEQIVAFKYQLELAIKYNLPAIIHIRESFDEVFHVIEEINNHSLFGIFHCFSGNYFQAEKAIKLGFKLGIGGVITYNNSQLPNVIKKIDLKHLVLETDSPYLTPVPYRGKRNQSSYIPIIGKKISELKNIPIVDVAKTTSNNAMTLFDINNNFK